MNIFFTCKNTLVILLQLYRLHVVQTETKSRRKQEKYDKYEIPNISIIYRNEKNKEGRNKRYLEDKRKRKLREIDIEDNNSNSEYSENIDKYDSSPKTRFRSVVNILNSYRKKLVEMFCKHNYLSIRLHLIVNFSENQKRTRAIQIRVHVIQENPTIIRRDRKKKRFRERKK